MDDGDDKTLVKLLAAKSAGAVVGNSGWRSYLDWDADANEDGDISEEELENKYREYLNGVFDMIDIDGDESVTSEELQAPRFDLNGARMMFNIVLPDMFIRLDQNKDGVLSRDEQFLGEFGAGLVGKFLPSRQEIWDTYSYFCLL